MLRTFFQRTGQPLNQPWLVALVGGLVKRFPLGYLIRMGWSTVFRPRTSNWSRTGRAIEEYVNERRAEQAKALGLDTKGGH